MKCLVQAFFRLFELRYSPRVAVLEFAFELQRLRRRQGRFGDSWHLDEMFVKIQGKQQYLWRAVDQEGDTIEILVQSRRDGRAARRFFRKLLKSQEQGPNRLMTDKLGSYRVAYRELLPLVPHDSSRWSNNRVEVSHESVRQRERQMRGSKSPGHAQRFLSLHGVVGNLFRIGRHKVRAKNYRLLRDRSFSVWQEVTCAR